MNFNDYFSNQAEEYAKYRPKYPNELFEYLSSIVNEHEIVWDSATGNGQAALGLAQYFKKVIATDASPAQISHAIPHPNIEYKTAQSENSGLESNSIDLITVATAIHWLNPDIFYPEVRRILKPGGVIAVWSYTDSIISPEIDSIMMHYSYDIIEAHWSGETKKTWNFEELVKFPFKRLKNPNFKIIARWNLHDFLNFLYTWSGTQNYIKNTGENPLEKLHDDLYEPWGGENLKRKISWNVMMKVGRV